MLNWLVQKFVKNVGDVENPQTREGISVFAGAMGIVCNLLLFGVKLPIGLLTGSIAITSDAFNNLSDIGSALVSIIGARMAGKRPDAEHPFGHGRVEYVAALIVAFIILFVGIELFRESVGRIMQPEEMRIDPMLLGILGLSIGIKLWMFFYNRVLGGRIQSAVLRAAAKDSINDVITTAVVVVASAMDPYLAFPVDGVAGLLVSLLILYSGYGVAKETVNQLLGGVPDPTLIRRITQMVAETEGVEGVHDLIVHDYGPGRQLASIHAEVPADGDFVQLHEWIDEAEQRVKKTLNVAIVIHMDPVALNDAQVDAARAQVISAVEAAGEGLSIHDFRMTDGKNRINLIFDLVIPFGLSEKKQRETVKSISETMAKADPRFRCVIQIDTDFSSR